MIDAIAIPTRPNRTLLYRSTPEEPRRRPSLQLAGILALALTAACETPVPRPTLSPAPVLEPVAIEKSAAGELSVVADPDLRQLFGRILSQQGVVIVPSPAWQVDHNGDWLLNGAASILFHVLRPPPEVIRVRLAPRPPFDLGSLRASWQGLAVDLPPAKEDGTLVLQIQPDQLPVGTHTLTLRAAATPPRISLRKLSWKIGERVHILSSQDVHRWHYYGDLLTRGVAGSNDAEKLAGLLFSGPRQLTVELPSTDGGRFVTRPQNSSESAARFHLQAGDRSATLELEPHARGWLELTIPAGVAELELQAEGSRAGLFLWGLPSWRAPRQPPQTPLVLVSLDTTRRDVLGPYGAEPSPTPNLDRFARRATVFDNAVTTAPWTLPSHASMFTGLYPSRHGAGVLADHLAPPFDTLAELLRRRGYRSLGLVGAQLLSFRYGFAQGFDLYRDAVGVETPGPELTDQIVELLPPLTDLDLFLFVNYFEPHYPYAPDVAEESASRLPSPWPDVLRGDGDAFRELVEGRGPTSEELVERLRRQYVEEIRRLDAELGRLFALLEQHDLYERALIVLVSDHGELLGEGGHFSHSGRLDAELLEVPLLVKWPGQRRGERVAQMVSVVDLFSTLLEAAGIEPPPGDGAPLRSAGDGAGERRFLLSEEHEAPGHPIFGQLRLGEHAWAIRRPDFRQILWSGERTGSRCLERRRKTWREVPCGDGATTAEELRQWLGEPVVEAEERVVLSDEDRQALRAMGYL